MVTNAQRATWRNSSDSRDRVELSVVFYAQYILNEDPGVSQHNFRAAWAKNAYTNPSGVANGLMSAVSFQDSITTALDVPRAATDGEIQSAVEAVVATIMKF